MKEEERGGGLAQGWWGITIERGGGVGVGRGGGSCYHKGQIRGEEGVKGNKINSINMADESDIWSTE